MKIGRGINVFLLIVACLFIMSRGAFAGSIPQLINYQGTLTNTSGTPVANGQYAVVFNIYDVPTGGTALWTETWNSSTTPVVTNKGNFNVLLGAHSPIPSSFFNDKPVTYLGIKVGNDSEMLPRQRITSVGYAFTAGDGVPKGGIIMWSGSVEQIPAGWALCNGQNGTPDLRDRFIVGAGSGYAVGDKGGAVTNNISHTHTTPAHSHSIDHTHTVTLGAVPAEGNNNGYVTVDWKDVGSSGKSVTGQHYHPTYVGGPSNANSGTGGSGNTGAAGASNLENRPPYYALAFIMKL